MENKYLKISNMISNCSYSIIELSEKTSINVHKLNDLKSANPVELNLSEAKNLASTLNYSINDLYEIDSNENKE